MTIAGGFAYDNVFMLDGVDITDSTFGSANDVFIEDAIEETQVITSGVSAEFGRFGGGVINAITKRGGNEFSGSFRTDFTNPSWRDETPFEDEQETTRESVLGKVFQATLGGPILRDRLWFFLAGRKENRNTQGTFPFSGVPFQEKRDDKRLEAKLTATVRPNHTLQGVYTTNRTSDAAPTFDFSIAPSTYDVTDLPQSLFVVNYNGVLRSNLFLEAQYSQQGLGFRDGDGSDTNLATGSPIFTFGNSAAVEPGQHYNAPYFDYGTDPQDRNNRQFTTSLSYFLSTAIPGPARPQGRVRVLPEPFKGGNSQSPTSFVYYADYKTDDAGDPVLDSNGNLTPVFVPGGGLILNWLAERGAVLNVDTTTLYLNDRWTLNNHWGFNLGLRYEQVRSDTTSPSIAGIDTTTIVPRLGVDFDPTGSGRFKLQGTYSHYAASYNPSQFGNNQGAGNPSLVYAIYVGPEGEGLSFAPGFDPQNYELLNASLPTGNVSFDNGLASPLVKEWTVSAGTQIGQAGFAKATYANRSVGDFVEDFTTFDLGTVEVTTPSTCGGCEGPFLLDRTVYQNSDLPRREYQALQLSAGYRVGTPLESQRELHLPDPQPRQLRGREHEPAGDLVRPRRLSRDPGGRAQLPRRPAERLPEAQGARLDDLRPRRWAGSETSAWVSCWRYDSALTYSLVAQNQSPSDIQLARDPGYAQPPGPTANVFFGERGVGVFAGAHLFDLAATYDIKAFRKLRPYVKFDMRNLFNDKTLGAGTSGFNTTIEPDENGPVDANGIPVNFVRGPNFGKATGNLSYPFPREFRIALGFRF